MSNVTIIPRSQRVRATWVIRIVSVSPRRDFLILLTTFNPALQISIKSLEKKYFSVDDQEARKSYIELKNSPWPDIVGYSSFFLGNQRHRCYFYVIKQAQVIDSARELPNKNYHDSYEDLLVLGLYPLLTHYSSWLIHPQ